MRHFCHSPGLRVLLAFIVLKVNSANCIAFHDGWIKVSHRCKAKKRMLCASCKQDMTVNGNTEPFVSFYVLFELSVMWRRNRVSGQSPLSVVPVPPSTITSYLQPFRLIWMLSFLMVSIWNICWRCPKRPFSEFPKRRANLDLLQCHAFFSLTTISNDCQ